MKGVKSKKNGGVPVVVFDETLGQHDYLSMRQYFTDTFFNAGEVRVVLDCEKLTDMPSIGFGVMCSLARDSRRMGGAFCVVNVCETIRTVMAQTHVDQQVKVADSIDEAVEYVKFAE